MSLVDNFQAHIGDLVMFTSSDKIKTSCVGFVRGYSDKKVKLSNRGYVFPNGNNRGTGFWSAYVGGDETRYVIELKLWDKYEILMPAKKSE